MYVCLAWVVGITLEMARLSGRQARPHPDLGKISDPNLLFSNLDLNVELEPKMGKKLKKN